MFKKRRLRRNPGKVREGPKSVRLKKSGEEKRTKPRWKTAAVLKNEAMALYSDALTENLM